MKKFPILILSLLLLISCTACVGNTDQPGITQDQTSTSAETNETAESTVAEEMTTAPQTEEPYIEPPEPTFPLVITTLDELRVWTWDNYSAHISYSFLTGNTAELAKYYGHQGLPSDGLYTTVDEAVMAPIKTLKFSDFTLTYENSDEFENSEPTLEFTVSESECDAFPVGEHSYTFREGDVSVWVNNKAPTVPEEYSFPQKVIEWLPWRCHSLVDGEEAYGVDDQHAESEFFDSVYNAHLYALGETDMIGITMEDAAESALTLFGIEDYVPPLHTYYGSSDDSDLIISRRLGNTTDVAGYIDGIRKENGQVIFELQLYADIMYLVPSHRVEYVFEKADTKYGWTLEQIKLVEQSEYEPYRSFY